ncbi:cytochrome oxidase assembly protein [Rubricoccus marinus]|uniref:Cytochrome oxidase assembly protein n=2 Tax=Rubricoccus marinus TaxID=716817 RepID=A0A259TY80_9BACT|nr:cytochrome oxidase assembly protein [Rubricoccus marinus]
MDRHTLDRQRRAARLAWITLGYTVLVILWGAVVRATGAGAGCGSHWPTCNGEIVPMAPSLNTIIEFGHRVTSGLALPLVLAMAVFVWRAFPRGAAVRTYAVLSVVFMIIEGAIGAGLVLLEYVALDARTARALWIAGHLINTFILLAWITLTAWGAGNRPLPRWLGSGARGASIAAALFGLIVLGASGAITALGDTLVLVGGLSPEEHALVETLVSLRILHPTLAFVVFGLVALAVWASRERPLATRIGKAVAGVFVFQLAFGALNVWLLAPLWMQVSHLLITDVIWIGFVCFAAQALGDRVVAREAAPVLA